MDIDFERPGQSIHRAVIGTDDEAVPAGHVRVINNGPGPRVLVVAGVQTGRVARRKGWRRS